VFVLPVKRQGAVWSWRLMLYTCKRNGSEIPKLMVKKEIFKSIIYTYFKIKTL
jgi:hypothetical protein